MWAGRTVWRPGVIIVHRRYAPEYFTENIERLNTATTELQSSLQIYKRQDSQSLPPKRR